MRWLLVLAAACSVPPPAHPVVATALAQAEASPDLDGAPIGHAAQPTIVIAFASWCEHCHDELAILDHLRASHRSLRILGLNYKGHEEYDHKGGPVEVRRFVAAHAPWLRVVPADDALFAAFGSPPKIPTLYVYDARGALVETYDRSQRAQPDEAELEALVTRLGRLGG